MGGPGVGEDQSEQAVEPENSPSTEQSAPATLEAGEIDPSQTPEEEKNGDTAENINDGAEPTAEADRVPGASTAVTEAASTSTSVDAGSSEQGSTTPPPDTAGKPVSPLNSSSTTINLQERARQRAHLRQAGMVTTSPTRARGRGVRGRGVRGRAAPGRGQSPG
ncbi:hypothetical protein CDL12_07260 [Handroanthus impetiginosus]|uniref:Uncharacterized protein n=1 Tax=Handroanthus impetiginosus TaxID=429701 RepID=A0A2G9HR94_9LAMI|nr:hypothetical protein CDL12_07260 [Handroanthus impetiginosus]